MPSPLPALLLLDGEPGSGDGHILERSAAVGGKTLHLAPGERRQWTFEIRGAETRYLLSVTYSNSRGGPNELLSLAVDNVPVGSFEARDSGEGTEGWNVFVTDTAGVSTLAPGRHTLVIESSGGDGCVEIDLVSVRPM